MSEATSTHRSLFCFGLGFCARHLIARLERTQWHIAGTVREAASAERWRAAGIDTYAFDGTAQPPGLAQALSAATHVLISAPPGPDADPVLSQYRSTLAAAAGLGWIGYLSTVGVYGEHHGGWVDETTPPSPVSTRSRHRRAAEEAWDAFSHQTGKRVVIFRLAGIYGPGRSAIDSVRDGRARRIIKPGQRFNRIHVTDIANAVQASMRGKGNAPILNVTDDLPAPPQDVIAYAAEVLGVPAPPEVAFEDAQLSAMARSFYGENKQVRNDLMKRDLGITLAYPTYREGLAAIAKATKS
ncbi:MAG TPA: SDR family oxidoreductase [Hyphomicrobiaceae bacterium]|nr:SDR family oxidoreductase [Hyphomicrobiaceae bacterium]